MRKVPDEWVPILREGELANSLFLTGLTALRRADYSDSGAYNLAFFGLSIGLERMAKLAILIDTRIETGAYPTTSQFKDQYRHRLVDLFATVEDIRARYAEELEFDLPDRAVAEKALAVLSEFATSTRYFNLDTILDTSAGNGQRRDPVAAWYTDVGKWILENKYHPRRRESDESHATAVDQLLTGRMAVRFLTEQGELMAGVFEAALRGRQTELLQREGTVIAACLGRHVSDLIWALERRARVTGIAEVPSLHELFGILYNAESMFRNRKVFTT